MLLALGDYVSPANTDILVRFITELSLTTVQGLLQGTVALRGITRAAALKLRYNVFLLSAKAQLL